MIANEKTWPSKAKVRVAVPRPPVTRARPCFPVLILAAVAPSATASRKRSMSARVTDATLSRPSKGFNVALYTAFSVASVLAFFAVPLGVMTRPAEAASM